jgi:hypothetical protein
MSRTGGTNLANQDVPQSGKTQSLYYSSRLSADSRLAIAPVDPVPKTPPTTPDPHVRYRVKANESSATMYDPNMSSGEFDSWRRSVTYTADNDGSSDLHPGQDAGLSSPPISGLPRVLSPLTVAYRQGQAEHSRDPETPSLDEAGDTPIYVNPNLASAIRIRFMSTVQMDEAVRLRSGVTVNL